MNFLSPRRLQLGILVCLSLSSSIVAAEEVEVTAEVAKLLALDGRQFDEFGNSLALDGDRLAIGTPEDRDNGFSTGSAYVFEREADGSWIQVAKLLALDGQEHDGFGISVSLDGDRVAIGATKFSSGSAYVFERDADGSWSQVSKLLALDGEGSDDFGISVSLDGDRLAVGAPSDDDNGNQSGSAYLFERNADGSWSQVSKLLPLEGSAEDEFGNSVSLDGDRVAIGAHRDNDNGTWSGSAYIFERDADGSWLQASKLLPIDGDTGDRFGYSVSLDGDRLAIGARDDDDNGSASGSAYVFERDADGSWSQVSKLLALDGQEGDQFGRSVSLDGDRLALGAFLDRDNGTESGSAYLFERDADGSWVQISKLLALDGAAGDAFGISVSLDGDRMAIGAHRDDDNGAGSGSAYIFESVLVSPQLTLSGTCPGEMQLTSTGTTPRSRFGIYGSPSQGMWEFDSGPCAGTVLDLDAPTSLRQSDSDFDAEGTLVRTVDASWCGTYLQVLDERTCLTSEVLQVPMARAMPKP